MMTWCFAMDYLQPNTHCSGLPPHWAGHTWSELLISKVSAFLMTPGRLGGDCGIRCTFLPLHAPDIPPYTRHQALTLSLLTFTRVWVNIWAPLCVRYSDSKEHKYREKRAVFAGVNSLSCLARPNTSSRPCDWQRFYLKTCQMFKYLPDSWHIFSKDSVSSPDMSDMSKAKDQGWMFDFVLSAQSRSLNVYSSLILSRSPLSHSGQRVSRSRSKRSKSLAFVF